MELFSSLLSAFGLSGAAGLNAYVPLFLVGMLQYFDKIHLAQPFNMLGEPWLLGIIGVIGALDLIGDKIPGVDHLLHVVGGVINTAAGAVLFASQAGIADVPPALSMVLGLTVAGGVHAARAATRPLATASTGGLANPVVSLFEDMASAVLSLFAVFAPVLVLLGVGALGFLGFRLWAGKKTRAVRV